MAKQKTAKPVVWPDERFKSETPASETFTAYGERPFDPVWGIEHWGSEIHGRRGPMPFDRLDENGEPVKLKDAAGEPVPDPDGPRDPATGKFLHFRHVKDLHDVVVLTGTGPGRGTQHVEANAPDWKLPAGLTLRPPFSEAGQSMLKELGLARRHSDTFEPLPAVLRATLSTECGVAPERLPRLTGPQIEEILRHHAAALGLVREQPAARTPDIAHSPDFRSVWWFGTEYAFTPQQSEIVKVLWEAHECRTPDVDAALLLSSDFTGSAAKHVRDIFRNSIAWGTMIVPGGSRGTYRLASAQ